MIGGLLLEITMQVSATTITTFTSKLSPLSNLFSFVSEIEQLVTFTILSTKSVAGCERENS